MSECQTKHVWVWLSEKEKTERSEVTEKPVSESFSFAEKVCVCAKGAADGRMWYVKRWVISCCLTVQR